MSAFEVMSGLGISEFDDSMWDEFFRVDQVMSNDGLECSNDYFPWHDSLRNPLCEVNCNSSHSENASVSRYTHLRRKQCGCSSLHDKCSCMSDTDSWSCKRSAVLPCSSESDLMNETSSVAFDDTKSSCRLFKIKSEDSHSGEFPENGTYLGNKRSPVDNESETTHQESSFNSFENINSTEFFPVVCPDIQTFEDVEVMFRSPDSTFSVGVNKDELSWLSPDNDEGAFRFEFSCNKSSTDANMSEDRDSSKSYLADDSAMASVPIKFEDSSCTLENSDSDFPFVNGPTIADSKDGFILRDERVGINDTLCPSILTNNHSQTNGGGAIHEIKKQFKPLNQLKGIRKERKSGKVCSRYLSNLPSKATQLHSAATSYENPSAHLQQKQKQALGVLNHISNAPLEKSHLPDQTSTKQPPSAVKPGTENMEKQHYNQVKLGSSTVQESSMQSLDNISPEAASFSQLQLVMEWLDFRTRLCIRDGLYRLAQGAERRHNYANLCGSSADGRTSSRLLIAEGTKTCSNFTNMEAVYFQRRFMSVPRPASNGLAINLR